jgi:GT2 family glycosyltransferase
MEEVELLERLSKQGIKTIFYPDALFIHVGGGSSSGRKDPVRNIYTGLQYLYQKNHSKNELIILQIMLKLKAIIAIGIGTLLQKKELIQTYNKAYASID